MLTKLLGLNTDELRALVQEEGEPAYRGNQLAEWIYQHGARQFEEMTNLPDKTRQKLLGNMKLAARRLLPLSRVKMGR